jgi:hypothetical protein
MAGDTQRQGVAKYHISCLIIPALSQCLRSQVPRPSLSSSIREMYSSSHFFTFIRFPKLVSVKGKKPTIKDNPPLIYHRSDWTTPKFAKDFEEAFEKYRETLTDDRKALPDHYKIIDIATKVVGVESVGSRCGILLLMADDDDALFLQVNFCPGALRWEKRLSKPRLASCGRTEVDAIRKRHFSQVDSKSRRPFLCPPTLGWKNQTGGADL